MTSKILKIIFYIIVLIELLFIVILSIYKLNNKFPNFNYSLFTIISPSMEPMLNVGDVIIVKKSDGNIKVGDVVTYFKDDKYITHEVISRSNSYVITKGINNNIADEPIKIDDIKYVMVRRSRLLTFIYKIINTYIFKVIFSVFMFFTLIYYLILIINYHKGLKHEKI